MLTLNEAQSEAVKIIDRHALILAGAGTGKTRIIIAKIYYLLSQKINPRQILAITFTNKAAEEMRNRIRDLLEKDGKAANLKYLEVRTFHSFGALILRSFINQYPPYNSNFTIIDDSEQKKLIKEIIEDKITDQEIRQLVNLFSAWKNKFLYPDDEGFQTKAAEVVPSKNRESFSSSSKYAFDLYQKYCEHLSRYNLLDFDDLIGIMVRLLKTNKDCHLFVTNRWKYLLVDEYQDTNVAQEKLIEVFIKAGSIITAVGDDSQSIYSFRGAHLENILSFVTKYQTKERKVAIVKLEQNYRSTQPILQLANETIAKNPVRFEKNLFTKSEKGELPVYRHFVNEFGEVEAIYRDIKGLIDQGEELSEIAVLYRTNYQSRLIEDQLVRHQIPYQILGGFKFYERKEVKEVLLYLNFLSNPINQVAFFGLVNFPPRGIGEKSVELFRDFLNQEEFKNQEILKVLSEENVNQLFKTIKAKTEILQLKRWLLESRKMLEENEPISKIVDFVIQNSGIYRHYSELKNTFERDQRLGNLDSFMDAVIYFEDQQTALETSEPVEMLTDETTVDPLQQFIEGVSLGLETNEAADQKDKVSLLTIHNAKGLEFAHVFVMGMEEGTFPHFISIEENNLEEERRLFYVAVTRAKKGLKLSSSELKRRQGMEHYCKVSRFIEEASDVVLEKKHQETSYDFGESNEYFD